MGFLQSESRVERPLFHHDKLINQQICCQNTPTKLFDTDKSENLSQLKPIQQINSIFLKRLLSFKIELFEQKGKKLSKRAVVFLISFLPWNSSYLLKIRWSQPLEKKFLKSGKEIQLFLSILVLQKKPLWVIESIQKKDDNQLIFTRKKY